MPTHAHGPFRRTLLGSVTAKVLHDAPCPVWTGPHMENAPERQAAPFHRILCALELDCEARTVLRWVAVMVRRFQSILAIVHAVPVSTVRLGPLYFDPAWRGQMVDSARDRIDWLKAEAGLDAEISVEVGDVHAAVSSAARQWRPDLMVVGRGRATAMLGGLRSNTYAILRDAPCPVLAI
jgi:nucleotide-binding universal stress UspA family protein